jgi:hypothetical protein
MITKFLMDVLSTAAAGLVSLLPAWTAPAWLATVIATMSSTIGTVTMLSGWVPISAIGTVVAFMLACSAIGLAVKIGRIVLSLFTGGGGSAA